MCWNPLNSPRLSQMGSDHVPKVRRKQNTYVVGSGEVSCKTISSCLNMGGFFEMSCVATHAILQPRITAMNSHQTRCKFWGCPTSCRGCQHVEVSNPWLGGHMLDDGRAYFSKSTTHVVWRIHCPYIETIEIETAPCGCEKMVDETSEKMPTSPQVLRVSRATVWSCVSASFFHHTTRQMDIYRN
jgi:hypothetical protein